MDIIILILIFILARFIARGLFDRIWRERVQNIIDSIRNERSFWYLMKQDINVGRVFSVYVGTRNQRRQITVGDCMMDNFISKYEPDPNDLDKKTITKNDEIEIVNSLNLAIKDREKIISEHLEKTPIQFPEKEIHTKFEEFEERYDYLLGSISNNYDNFIRGTVDSLTKNEISGVAIWEILKKIEDGTHDFEYDSTGNKQVGFLDDLKLAQSAIITFFIDLLSEKNMNKETAQKLKKALVEWQQLHMLRWCVVDYSIWTMGTNGIQRGMWHVAISVFL